jgi:hypothetical protein
MFSRRSYRGNWRTTLEVFRLSFRKKTIVKFTVGRVPAQVWSGKSLTSTKYPAVCDRYPDFLIDKLEKKRLSAGFNCRLLTILDVNWFEKILKPFRRQYKI